MRWSEPSGISKSKVNRAGDILSKREDLKQKEIDNTIDILGKWRASHIYPMHVFRCHRYFR